MTHVVAGGDHTDKVRWGRQQGLHVVGPAWVHESGETGCVSMLPVSCLRLISVLLLLTAEHGTVPDRQPAVGSAWVQNSGETAHPKHHIAITSSRLAAANKCNGKHSAS